MSEAAFIRVLDTAIGEKGLAILAAVNDADHHVMYTVDPQAFRQIPGSPFAYWTSEGVRRLFVDLPTIESLGFLVQHGASSKNDFRFLRIWYEVNPAKIGSDQRWMPFAKGGEFSRFYSDVHLLINWANDGQEIHEYVVNRYPYLNGNSGWILHPENAYTRPGLTWPRRTDGLSVRILPSGCVFADKGPAIFLEDDNLGHLTALLAVMNSSPFGALVRVQLARTHLAQSFEIGLIQATPIPESFHTLNTALVLEAHDLVRRAYQGDETTHVFGLPWLVCQGQGSLLDRASTAESMEAARTDRLVEIRSDLDEATFDLYGLNSVERAWVYDEMGGKNGAPLLDDTEEDDSQPEDLPIKVQNLLMWCVGVAFGRWDVRFALDSDLLPDLQGPFDPLPRCVPGALIGSDGLPSSQTNIASEAWLSARESVLHVPEAPLPADASANITPEQYPLSVAWNGILVDDPSHPADLVNRVRQVLALLWGDRAGDIEKEGCEILGYKGLRDYFRDPRKGFFAFHIKRYSKSRRKAPLYWLLQSENRNYAIWLYYHRLDDTTYFTAARDYADTKVNLETARLDELRQGLAALSGSAQKRREREIERQQKLVSEVTTFRNKLDEIALHQLPPDHNDGVIISIAPLWELVPWKDAEKMWQELTAGKYEWSTMAQQMKARGLVKT